MSDLIERLVSLSDRMQRMDDITERDMATVLNAKDKLEAKDRRIAELEDKLTTWRGHTESLLLERIAELEAKVTRLTSRGFEDLHDENERLRAALRLIESPGDITTPEELAYVASEALAAVDRKSTE